MSLTLASLPEDILHDICDYLDVQSLKSASLAHRSLSQVYQRHCHQTLTLDLRSEHPWQKFELIERWDHRGWLKHVRLIVVKDSGERSRDGKALLRLVLSQAMPKMAGLRRLIWNVAGRTVLLEDDFRFPQLPSRAYLEVQATGLDAREVSVPVASQILSGLQHHMSLYSLKIAFDAAAPQLHVLFKTVLMTCSQLRVLKVHAHSESLSGHDGFPHDLSSSELCWTPEEMAMFPALEELDLDYTVLTDGLLNNWATYGNWQSLQKLTLRDTPFLQYLSGRTPALHTISVGALPWLGIFLEQSVSVETLAITGLHNHPTDEDRTAALRAILDSPVTSNLKVLELQLLDENILIPGPLAVASACPKLRELVLSIQTMGYQPAADHLHWEDVCTQAVVNMPNLRRFTAVVPHVVHGPLPATSPERYVTLSTVDILWKKLWAAGRRLESVAVVAWEVNAVTCDIDGLLTTPTTEDWKMMTLNFIAVPVEKDWDAEKGKYRVDCLELEQAEASLACGDLHNLCESGRYIDARKTVDELVSVIERGYIKCRKTPRPMPDYATTPEEQDSRCRPTHRRRASRFITKAINSFVDNFRPHDVDADPQLSQ